MLYIKYSIFKKCWILSQRDEKTKYGSEVYIWYLGTENSWHFSTASDFHARNNVCFMYNQSQRKYNWNSFPYYDSNVKEHDVKKLDTTWFESPFADSIEATVNITWFLKDQKMQKNKNCYIICIILKTVF